MPPGPRAGREQHVGQGHESGEGPVLKPEEERVGESREVCLRSVYRKAVDVATAGN